MGYFKPPDSTKTSPNSVQISKLSGKDRDSNHCQNISIQVSFKKSTQVDRFYSNYYKIQLSKIECSFKKLGSNSFEYSGAVLTLDNNVVSLFEIWDVQGCGSSHNHHEDTVVPCGRKCDKGDILCCLCMYIHPCDKFVWAPMDNVTVLFVVWVCCESFC